MSEKKVVIYCRYSSDMQRPDSCADQERTVRAALARLGLSGADAVVIYDEAESGTKTARDGFQRVRAMVARGEVAVLAVDDQSRLTRADNAYAFVKDLVFAGGRFVSTGEGIDTAVPAWELKVQVLQLHHGQTVRDLQHRVHRGQRGRVEADGSAGDFPFGYESYYLDPAWAEQLARRGPKPKKGIRICEDEARWVRQVFAWFVAGRSIGWIARELTRLKVSKGRRASRPGWHPQQVHRMLANAKYVGRWVWGRTAVVRDSQGRKKQTAVPPGQEVTRDRFDLRIVEPAVWDRAAVRLAELGATFGYKDGQKRRGPRPNPADVYPRSPLGGVLVCGACGARLWQHHSNARRYYACPAAKKGLCDVTAQVPAGRAEGALTAFLLDVLRGWPEWMQTLYRLTCDAVRAAANRVPEDRERDTRRAAELDRQIHNLVNALAEGGLTSPAVTVRLREAEAEKAEVDRRLAGYAEVDPTVVVLPAEAWVAARLGEWAIRAASADGPESLLRLALESVAAEPVVAAGKKRGFIRLRFRVNAWGVLAAVVGDSLPSPVRGLLTRPAPDGATPEFTLDLGGPTKMDSWAPRIAEWRTGGVTWEEIVRRTGMDLNRVYVAWKRYTGAAGDTPPAA
jgi:DNA invertase Pin-like site-specific DNA recombinase